MHKKWQIVFGKRTSPDQIDMRIQDDRILGKELKQPIPHLLDLFKINALYPVHRAITEKMDDGLKMLEIIALAVGSFAYK